MGYLSAHYQPIVSLDDGSIVGYEALAREDGAFPAARFAAARDSGTLAQLDVECMRAALSGAAGLGSTLFVNVEPETFDAPPSCEAPERVIVELTERGLTARPAELLLAVERVRARGWGIALDDVGADWRSLALMPFLRPDVVKLDRGVLADGSTLEAARVVRGARAHVERHGGLLLAEGIEDAHHERRAAAFGAALGQGWRFGRPAAGIPACDGAAVDIVQPVLPIGDETPFEILAESGAPRGVGTKGELLPLSIDLEREAAMTRDPAVILATFQDEQRFTPRVRERYTHLARGAAFVAAFGVGMSPEPAPGVRGARLETAERLRDEWTVIVVGPHSALALIARDLGDTRGDDMERRFEYALTHDRELVLRAGRALMLRVAAEPGARPSFRADLAVAGVEIADVASQRAARVGAPQDGR